MSVETKLFLVFDTFQFSAFVHKPANFVDGRPDDCAVEVRKRQSIFAEHAVYIEDLAISTKRLPGFYLKR